MVERKILMNIKRLILISLLLVQIKLDFDNGFLQHNVR